MHEPKTAATEQETTETEDGAAAEAEAESSDGFTEGLTGGDAAKKEKAAAQDTEAKTDEAADETDSETDTEATAAVTEAKKEKPAAEKAKTAEKEKPDEAAAKLEAMTEKAEKQAGKLLQSMAKTAAFEAGVRTDRVDKAVKLADLDGIDPMAEDANEKLKAALQTVVDEMPELAAEPAGTGSTGAFVRKKETAKEDPFLQGLRG